MMRFQPLPLLANAHVQTVLGNLPMARARGPRPAKRLAVLPDGDCIVVHETAPHGAKAGDDAPIALLVHGLGGSHQSGYMQRTSIRLSRLGWRVLGMDLRAAGAGVRLARRFYTAACSADVRAVVAQVGAAFPQAPLAIVGFSLGGNIVLKYAGEVGAQPPPGLRAIAALAPPIDLVGCSALMAKYPLYDAFYVHHLTRQVALHQASFPDLPPITFPRRTVLRQFDDLYTAPRWGYADALDYYRQASALPWIGAIRVPTFILTARDDPFVAVESFEALRGLASVELHISAHGGHLGFLGLDDVGGIRWAETQMIAWLTRNVFRCQAAGDVK